MHSLKVNKGEKNPPVGLFWFMPMENSYIPKKGMMIEENGALQGIKGTNKWDELGQLTPTT